MQIGHIYRIIHRESTTHLRSDGGGVVRIVLLAVRIGRVDGRLIVRWRRVRNARCEMRKYITGLGVNSLCGNRVQMRMPLLTHQNYPPGGERRAASLCRRPTPLRQRLAWRSSLRRHAARRRPPVTMTARRPMMMSTTATPDYRRWP